MEFELLDRYLLDGALSKDEVVSALLKKHAPSVAARPFYEGLRRLGAHTPDLALIALRLVLSGRKADDENVTQIRDLVQRVRAGGPQAEEARASYAKAMG
jgi:hypothetical protein